MDDELAGSIIKAYVITSSADVVDDTKKDAKRSPQASLGELDWPMKYGNMVGRIMEVLTKQLPQSQPETRTYLKYPEESDGTTGGWGKLAVSVVSRKHSLHGAVERCPPSTLRSSC